MLSGYKIFDKRSKDVPIDHECCIKHQSSRKHDDDKRNAPRILHREVRISFLTGLLIAGVLIFCLALIFCAWIIIDSNYASRRIDETLREEISLDCNNREGTVHQNSQKKPSRLPPIEEVFQDVLRNAQQLLSLEDKRRFRRDAKTWNEDCQMKIRHCKKILEAMQEFVDKVNSSLPFLQNHLKNTPRSKLMDLVECLQCKYTNDKDNKIDDDQHATHELSRGTHDVKTVKILLDGNRDKPFKSQENFTDTSILDNEGRSRTTVLQPPTTKETIEHCGSTATVEPTKTNERTTAVGVDSRNSSVYVTKKSHPDSVMNIVQDDLDFSTHTTMQANSTAILANTSTHPAEGRSRSLNGGIDFSKIMTAKKEGYDSNLLTAPTAETIKSSQQLQLTPAMTWMPYPVCFFGYPPSGRGRQIFPGPSGYPISSPSAAFPMTNPHRKPFANPAAPPPEAAVPSYMQVQAQTVQVLPYPRGLPQDVTHGPRFGPSAPGYPGFVPGLPTGSTAPAARSPFYCTYLPAPTFQYPTVPGAQDYQRNANSNRQSWQNQKLLHTGVKVKCTIGYRECADGSDCVPRSKWCDGEVQCADASDETVCSCRDRISRDRLCDGYFDCPHGEDELGCFGCPMNSFSCGEWEKRQSLGYCVQLSERCDGIKQCPNGKDEMDCYILTPSYMEGKDVFTVGYTEGYLHRNFRGQWYPACAPTKSWAAEACASETGSDTANDPPLMEKHYVEDESSLRPFLTETATGELQEMNSCGNLVVYVRCPRVLCGTRVFTQDELPIDYYSYQNVQSEKSHDNEENRKKESADSTLSSRITEAGRESNMPDNSTIVGTELRVVGGHASKPKAWPFLVAIYRNGEFHCGGVILNEHWILTAAHCLHRYQNYYYEVQAGVLRRHSFSPMAQTRKAVRVIRHSDYNNMRMTHDIGMILLDKPLGFNRWVRPVCLPEAQTAGDMWKTGPPAATTCIAIGWGATREHGPDPDHLREVEIPILPSCKHPTDQNDAEICAGVPQGGRDACQGDSGGPLMCRNPKYPSQWYVAGIVSHGDGCGRPDEPGAYTKVSYFVNWIQQTMQNIFMSSIENDPLEKCPGFSCTGGLRKCLPVGKRCDLIIDCLDGEDEKNCHEYRAHAILRESENIPVNFTSPSRIGELNADISNTVTPESVSTTETFETQSTLKENSMMVTQTPPNEIRLSFTTTNSPNTEDSKAITNPPTTISPPHAFFTCTDLLQRVFVEKRCDKVIDCEDGTDEKDCTCKDYLIHSNPNAICDGRVDCMDLSDEKNCAPCAPDEFFCRRSSQCIPAFLKCDGETNCPLGEDEEDCYTLSNGMFVKLDVDGRPLLNIDGIFTVYTSGEWQPACHEPHEFNNESTVKIIGQNMCRYFGFSLQSAESVTVRMMNLPTISPLRIQTSENYSEFNNAPLQAERTCQGLHLHCRPILNSNADVHLLVDRSLGSHEYRWPWSAAIFVDGRYRCTAILLEPEWLLSAAKCLTDIRLPMNYTVAVLGTIPKYSDILGPYQQISVIDDIKFVENSNASLLHLREAINSTRYVQPLYIERKIFPPLNGDYCVAIGTDNRNQTKSIFLQPVLKDCEKCHRCFINDSIPECQNANRTISEWSGVVVCHGLGGWYPAAVFDEVDGLCSFEKTKSLLSIDYINAHMMKAMEEKLRPYKQPVCEGFRCSIGQCISKDRICNGIKDCSDGMDEDLKLCNKLRAECVNDVDGCGCAKSELRCESNKCVPKSAFCDGIGDCPNNADEPDDCSCVNYLRLTAPEKICDGIWHCLDKTDESPELCPCKEFSYRCNVTSAEEKCIPQDFLCDGQEDCPEGDDEMECTKINSTSTDSFGKGEIIHRSYGVWHSECFPAATISSEDISNLCKASGFTSGNFTLMDDTNIKPVIPLRDNFYVVRLNSQTWVTLRTIEKSKPLIKLVEPTMPCHRLYVSCF